MSDSGTGGGELLALRGVSKRYRRGSQELCVLRDVSLTIRAGELVCVLGTRGQGKTTLLRIAAGMESADAGAVRFAGRELAGLSDAELSRLLGTQIAWAGRSGPGMRMRMLDYVATPLLVGRGRGGDVERRARAALERVGASDCAEAGWETISDWERALVELAQAIAGDPALLLIDDVTDMLGVRETDEFVGLLRSLTRESQLAVLMSASNPQATLLADRIASLAAGTLTEGPPPGEGVVIEFPGSGPGRREAGHGIIS